MEQNKQLRDFDSLFELFNFFDTEEKCIDYLASLRWNGNPVCPYCGNTHNYVVNVKGRGKSWKCSDNAKCGRKFSVKVGTIFEDSPIPLRKWFIAVYLITAHKKGISSHQLAKDIKVTQKTAWYVLHRVREAFEPENNVKVGNSGDGVEIDETYVGGKEKNKHKDKKTDNSQGRSTKSKTPVLGIIERDGKVFAIPVKNTKSEIILPIISDKVEAGSKVYTDEWVSYKPLSKEYEHKIVNHSASEYVNGEAHTNNIESFWALLKRGIFGIYHHVSDEHLGRYVNEFTFRFNNRKMTDGSRFDVVLANTEKGLTYKKLTKKI